MSFKGLLFPKLIKFEIIEILVEIYYVDFLAQLNFKSHQGNFPRCHNDTHLLNFIFPSRTFSTFTETVFQPSNFDAFLPPLNYDTVLPPISSKYSFATWHHDTVLPLGTLTQFCHPAPLTQFCHPETIFGSGTSDTV